VIEPAFNVGDRVVIFLPRRYGAKRPRGPIARVFVKDTAEGLRITYSVVPYGEFLESELRLLAITEQLADL
jgi:hypothetical protein